ncbi:hypothetical protein [Nonomuraea sp. NPDC005501]|uniref:hypothetical protein n=1 Tax=Nonomuraea sp. NPDC005501 TaxID=3156884 RepID=UPI0033B7E646
MKVYNVVIRTVVALSFALLISGCSGEAEPLEVDTHVLGDMRSVGRVLAETETEAISDGSSVITRLIIVDVDGSGVESELAAASARLQGQGWKVADERPSQWIEMHSNEWRKTRITIFSSGFFQSSGRYESSVERALRSARSEHGSDGFLVLDAHRTDG